MNRVICSLVLVTTLFFTNGSLATSYSDPSTIKGITVGSTIVRVFLDTLTGDFESCTTDAKKVAYAFDPSLEGGDFMLSVVLAAKMSQQKLSFQSIGCKDDYSKISHIYLCDSKFCN